jgi:subtilisin family serine protease
VGAYSSSGALASFSNRVGSSGAVQVDAPGVGVYSTYIDGRYGTLSGTSMATPQVAGLAALALSANPSLTAAQLRTLIVNGANHSISGSDSRGGINAAITVALARAGITSASSSSVAAASRSSTASQIISSRRLGSASVAEFDAVSVLPGETASSEVAMRQVLVMPASESAPVTARQLALVALNVEAGWDLDGDTDTDGMGELSPDELLLQLLDESAPWA